MSEHPTLDEYSTIWGTKQLT